jgi:hypothetical protein
MEKGFKKILLLGLIVFFVLMPNVSNAQITSVKPISVSSDEVLGDGDSISISMTPDGRYVVFYSDSTNLVANDTNGVGDLFLRDTTLGTTTRISVNTLGQQGDNASALGSITSDGKYIFFDSYATNLVADDTNGEKDIFLRDTTLGTTTRINVNALGQQADGESTVYSITPDGKYLFFTSIATNLVDGDSNNKQDVFMLNISTGEIERVSVSSTGSEANGDSYNPDMSDDGRYVSFSSAATNLVPGDTNNMVDIFVRDRILGTTERVSVSSAGIVNNGATDSPEISNDGRFVVFSSAATNLVANDTNSAIDIFLHDRTLGTTTRVSVSSTGAQANSDNTFPLVSTDGRFVTFASSAANLVADDTNGDSDIFVHDTLTGNTERVSLKVDGTQASGALYNLSVGILSGDARYIILSSGHSDIIPGDNNSSFDVFLYELDDADGIDSEIELAAPNEGDVNENSYADSVEQNITSLVNSVSGGYTTIETTGQCTRNNSLSSVSEDSLGSQDADYEYPAGVVNFSADCLNPGETATVSVYFFSEDLPLDGTVARKYNSSTGEYTTIDSAVIEEVTINGERALKMTYDVVDGGPLDEDGLENGIITDPVGFARVVYTTPTASSDDGSSIISSGSMPIKNILTQNTISTTSLVGGDSLYKTNIYNFNEKRIKTRRSI